jgi:drug/metabolite transporter (DMT)-like permease
MKRSPVVAVRPSPVRGSATVDAGTAALLGTTMFFWGTAFRATAVGGRYASPIVFSTLRAVPATVSLLAVVGLTRGRLPRDRRTIALGALCGLLTVALSFEGLAEATKLAGPGNAAVLINTAPFFTVLLARVALHAHTPRIAVGGLVVGFTGVVVMVSSQLGGSSIGHLALGTAIALLTAAGFATGALIIARTARRHPELDMLGFTALQYVVGSLTLAVLMVIYGDPGGADWSSAALWAAVAWVALGSSATASMCFNLALRRVSAARATAWQFLAPVVAVVVEAARGYTPGPLVVLGMALAITGVAVVSIAQSTAESTRA